MSCNCEVRLQTHNVAYNVDRNLWAISDLANEKLQIQCLQKTYCFDVKTPFQLVFLPNGCETYSRNTYIPVTVEFTNNDPNLTLQKDFWVLI